MLAAMAYRHGVMVPTSHLACVVARINVDAWLNRIAWSVERLTSARPLT